MSRHQKLYRRIMDKSGDRNISFDALRALLVHLGFDERIRGGHHIFVSNGIEEIINLQPVDGLAKPYQVKQVRDLFVRYGLRAGSGPWTPDTK